jgi:hypothetical protein
MVHSKKSSCKNMGKAMNLILTTLKLKEILDKLNDIFQQMLVKDGL